MTTTLESLRGRVGFHDRTQRIMIGLILLVLNVIGMVTEPGDALRWAALIFHMDLIVTGLAGWCPVYWTFKTTSCRVG